MVHGELATTDSDGQSVCLSYDFVNLTLPTYYYTGPINTDPVIVVDGTTVTGGFGREFLDLTSAYPDEELFKQCKYIMTNPPPVFLTPVNSIKLPQSTLPKTGNAASPTPTGPTTSPTRSARPVTPPIVVPSPTTTSQLPPTVTEEPEEPSPPTESDNAPLPPPSSDDNDDDGQDKDPVSPPPQESDDPSILTPPGDENEEGGDDEDEDPAPSPPQESDDTPKPPEPIDNDDGEDENPAPPPTMSPGTSAVSPENTAAPPITAAEPEGDEPITAATVTAPVSSVTPILGLPSSSSLDGNNEVGPAVIVGGSTTIVAGGGAAVGSGTTFSVLPSTGGVIAIADGRTRTLPLPTNAPSANDGFVQPITSAAPGFVLPGQTLSEGGEAVLIGSTSFSALPSGSGVVAISEGGSTTLQSSELSNFGISTVADNPDAFVLPGQTLTAGGSAAVIDSATYSVLPDGSGINVASGGQTSLVAAAKATNIPGVGEIISIDDASNGYVLGGSVTLLLGGTDATISGTVYTALPSGFGILAGSDADEFAAYIEQGLSGEQDQGSGGGENYIIGVEGLSGQATTVSGIAYSVLPSGSGVLIDANGHLTTLEIGPTGHNSDGGGSVATATGGSDADESVVPYTGDSASQTGTLGSVAGAAYLGVFGAVGACLVL
jgi:hypothetical protein